ncbi:MAG TPA: hypothetical protein VNC39_01705 [Acidocella sp.]|uniref:hypothetical protein n=1 Tax=Acidocella sp. TaxID=50710 RepID=UPI002BDCDF9E|nr:hypothetical protein [Acidocella sp.]HVE20666.1 hypothetical protein [Acidocella sp.]
MKEIDMFFLMLTLGMLALALTFTPATRRLVSTVAIFRPGRVGLASLAFGAVLGAILFSPRLALAATGAPAQVVDLTQLWGWVLSVAIAVITFYGRRALVAIESRLSIQSGSAAADDLDQALVHGEAFLMNGLKALAASTSTVTIAAGPLANAVSLVQKLAPAAEDALGVTPADIEAMLLARIGVPAATIPAAQPTPPAASPATPAPAAA